MNVSRLDHLNLSVENLAETVAWYGRVFGFEVVEDGMQHGQPWCVVRSGDALLCLAQAPGRAHPKSFAVDHDAHRLNHLAFAITDEAGWRATLEAEGLELLYGGEVVWPHSRAWYVVDPTGYEIEVALWTGGAPKFGP